jgi:hypothetical protein
MDFSDRGTSAPTRTFLRQTKISGNPSKTFFDPPDDSNLSAAATVPTWNFPYVHSASATKWGNAPRDRELAEIRVWVRFNVLVTVTRTSKLCCMLQRTNATLRYLGIFLQLRRMLFTYTTPFSFLCASIKSLSIIR